MHPFIGKLTSVFGNRCPRCHKGHFFTNDNPFVPGFWRMNDKCATCDQDYMLEPGFYYGAMYTSYAINVAIFVIAWMFSILVLPEETAVWNTVGLTMGIGLICSPLTFRWSRLVWINFFVSHSDRPDISNSKN